MESISGRGQWKSRLAAIEGQPTWPIACAECRVRYIERYLPFDSSLAWKDPPSLYISELSTYVQTLQTCSLLLTVHKTRFESLCAGRSKTTIVTDNKINAKQLAVYIWLEGACLQALTRLLERSCNSSGAFLRLRLTPANWRVIEGWWLPKYTESTWPKYVHQWHLAIGPTPCNCLDKSYQLLELTCKMACSFPITEWNNCGLGSLTCLGIRETSCAVLIPKLPVETWQRRWNLLSWPGQGNLAKRTHRMYAWIALSIMRARPY